MHVPKPSIVSEVRDHDCMVCYRLLIEPTRLPCSHVLCFTCVQEIIDFSALFCPLCRQEFPNTYRSAIDFMTLNEVRLKYPDDFLKEYAERKQSNQLEQMLARIKVKIGNLSSLASRGSGLPGSKNRYEWTFFLKCDEYDISKIVQKVRLELPKEYQLGKVELQSPFVFTGIGSSAFVLPLRVYWKPWVNLPIFSLKHQMKLDDFGVQGFFIVKVPRKDLNLNLYGR